MKFQRKRTRDYMDKTSYIKDTIHKPERSEGSVSVEISEKSLRGLPKGVYSFAADPYDASLPGSKPYPILDAFNKKIGGKYKGLRNIDGGNVQQYANSLQSFMLAYADFIYAKLPINYRNLPINLKATEGSLNPSTTDYAGYYLVDEMRKAISEAVSILKSTTFTQMAINGYGIVTDLAMGSAQSNTYTINGVQTQVYDNLTDVLYGCSTFYQLVLQAGLGLFNWHNSFRLKMGTMIRRSWNRETPILNALFGLFKKKSFLSFMDSIALSFEGEYVDKDEMQQINMLTLAPSARSNALTDPVMELGVKFNRPGTFKIVALNRTSQTADVLFDYDVDMSATYKTGATTSTTGDYFGIIDKVIDKLSANSVMAWARDPQTTASDDTNYYNKVKWMIDAISITLTKFKTLMNDVREVFDTMTRTGTLNWEKGYIPSIVKDTDADMFDNLIINDIFKIMASSADSVDFDEATKRWRTFSLWNMYDGIPEYDTYQGGSFLTLSLKTLNYQNDSDEIHKYLPIRFTVYDGVTLDENQALYNFREFTGVCRDGVILNIDGKTTVQMRTDATLARLAPLASQNSLLIRIPKITNVNLSVQHRSCAYKILTQIFGMCQIKLTNNTDISLDPDIIAIYQIELEDITNEAITYARAHAPFKGTTSTVDILGFTK